MFQVLLPMKGDHWLIVLVEKQKSSISVYHRFYFRCYSIGKNTTETRHNFLAHRHIADTAFRFRSLNYILHLRCSLQLVVYLDTLLVELKIGDRQPAELRDSQPRVKENIDRIVVSAEMLIFLDEFQKITLLLTGNCFSGDGIVYDHRCQFKSKRIFTDQIIIYRQLKSRSQNTSDGVNRAVPSAIHLLKLDQPRLCIRQANLVNALLLGYLE